MQKKKVGIIGCGNISEIYLKNLRGRFESVELVACADIVRERAETKAAEHGIRAVSVEELLADPEIEIVVNLTIPKAHFEVAMKAVAAGKSVHNEKPLCLTREEGRQLLKAARSRRVRVGSAPDTFLGAGIQTCRKLIDDGAIGELVAADAFMMCHGHESWHPDPEFYYQVGGGPMFDMGPYYLTALVALLGPVKSVAGMTRISFPERVITSEKKRGQKIKVEVPTHIAGLMEFGNGAIGTIITSFDVWGAQVPRIEVHGTEASLSVPDPNGFGGPVKLRKAGEREWTDVPLTHGYAENSRGIGVADMACAIASRRPHRCSEALAFHVLDLMHSFHDASDKRRHVNLRSKCDRPAALPVGLADGALEL